MPMPQSLAEDLRQIIDQARGCAATTADSKPTMIYRHIGERINRKVLDNRRAGYGKQIVEQVAQHLQAEYGTKGLDEKSIRRMIQFAQLFPSFQIVATLSRQLSWSHFVEIISLSNDIQREFYLTLATSVKWSIRHLQKS